MSMGEKMTNDASDENVVLGNVVFHESREHQVTQRIKEIAASIKSEGYGITTTIGTRPTEGFEMDYDTGLGLLELVEGTEEVPGKYLGILKRTVPKRNIFLGVLWVNNEARDAELERRWQLDINGRENLPKLTQLATELSELYVVKVDVYIECEQTKFEEHL